MILISVLDNNKNRWNRYALSISSNNKVLKYPIRAQQSIAAKSILNSD